jgi:hypothetical protein
MYGNYNDPKITEEKPVVFYDMAELKQFPFTTNLSFSYKKRREIPFHRTIDPSKVISWAIIIGLIVLFGYLGFRLAHVFWALVSK